MAEIISGTFKIPEGKILLEAAPVNMEWKLVPKEKSRIEQLEEAKEVLLSELKGMKEPDDKELIELGRSLHIYYQKLYQLQLVEEELKSII